MTKVNFFDLIHKKSAAFIYGRRHQAELDYRTIFHHFGTDVKQDSTETPIRIGNLLKDQLTKIMRKHDKHNYETVDKNTHLIHFTTKPLNDIAHCVVAISCGTSAIDPVKRPTSMYFSFVLPNHLAVELIRRVKSKPAETIKQLYSKIVNPEDNARDKNALPRPLLHGTRLTYVTPERKEILVEKIK